MQIERFPPINISFFKKIMGVFRQHPIFASLGLILTVLTCCFGFRALDFQIKEFKVRNRPMLSIPVNPVLQVDSNNNPKNLMFVIKNLSDIPAMNISVVSEVFINGNSVERLGPTSFDRLDKENPLPYKIYVLEDTKDKYLRVKILLWYEGVSDAGEAWFESGLEETLFLNNKTVTEHRAYEKAHWGEKRSSIDSDIYQAFLDMKLI